MNHDDHKPDLSTLIDPELEARVVAWVSGEASPFEAAELARLTNEKPELAIFKRRIAAVSGLIGEAIRPDKEPLRLAPDRRTKLLQALGVGESNTAPTASANTVALPLAYSQTKKQRGRRQMLAIAASLTVGLFTLISFRQYQSGFEMDKEAKNSRQEPISVELPVAENVERRAEVYRKERREDAFKAATSEEQKKMRESEASKSSSPLVQKSKQADHEKRVYGAVRYNSAIAKAGNRPELSALPKSPSAPSRELDVAGDLAEYAAPPTLAGTRVHTDLKDVASNIKIKSQAAIISNEFFSYSGTTVNGGVIENSGYASFSKPLAPADGHGRQNAPAVLGSVLPHTSIRAAYEGSGLAAVTGDSDKIVLSPFMIEGKKDAGYLANDTLTVGRDRQAGKEIDAISADLPLEKAKAPAPAQTFTEISAAKEPVSTFSLHVSDVSFRLAQAALAKGETLDRASIRPEEFYNAFSYGDPTPALAEKVSCRIEQAAHPFAQQRNLVRIAVKVAAAGRDAAQPLHLTVLLDTSGSMEREDRAATIQSAMKALTSLLGPNDRLTLIGFSRQPRLLAEALPGDQAGQVQDLIKNTPAEGGTNLEEALKLGSELAHRQFNAAAQNRIVLLTDGAANLGNANPAQLAASIEALRQQGIAFDACGVGLEGLDDGMLENLTRKGDGRYYVLNSPEAADAGFAKQLAGAFRPAAENVKLQVRFNPARVGHYRLIGFEQHRLREEDFRNDSVDAAELAAEEAAVAVYQVEALPQGEGELGEVYVRFRDASSGNMVERSWTLNYDAQAAAFDRATPSMQLAGTAALLAEKLQGGEAANAINLGDLAPIVNKLRSQYANEPRVQELVTMFEQARKLAGE